MTILNKRLYEDAIDCAFLCKLYYCISLLRNWFSIGVNDQPLREIESIFVIFDCPKSEIVHPLMLLNVNTHANNVIEISFALMKFMEVLMNVYLPYSFNCWRRWIYILRKWTAKGVVILVWASFSNFFVSSPTILIETPSLVSTLYLHLRSLEYFMWSFSPYAYCNRCG